MLETFVPSRIRRTLLEHLLTHPSDRFYLRGLAKELGLTVSPLRRELKRLEALGVLKAYQEANIRFYVVDQAAAKFIQLKSLAQGSMIEVGLQSQAQQPEPLITSTVLSHEKVERIRRALRPVIHWPVMLGLAGLVVVLMLGAVASYLAVTNQRLVALTRQAVTAPPAQVTVVESVEPRPASGEMHSSRWRVMPGTMGGFSARAGEGTY